jgi:hypothetical protein
MTIINSTISRNTATFSGGIKQGGGTLTITHSTITANTALSQAGGLRNGGTVNLFNTILADNNSPDGPDGRNFGTINSQGHNLIGNNSGFVFTPGAGDLVGTSTSPIDPQLGPLQDNGGSNFTHAFVGCSPAIDAGDNTAAPATDQRGFTRIVDGDGDSIATIDIGAFEAVLGNCANQPPVANDDAADTDEDTPVVIDVVANDVDDDANLDSTTVTVTIGPSNGGTVVNTTTGEVTYSPAPDFNGSDSFVYEVCDTEGLCDTATVSITVNAVNDPSTAVDDSYSLAEDNILTVPAPGVLANDSDPEGDSLSASLVAEPSNGVVIVDTDGSFSYTPNTDFNGTDSFIYGVNDGPSGTSPVVFTPTAGNGASADGRISRNFNGGTSVSLTGLMVGDDSGPPPPDGRERLIRVSPVSTFPQFRPTSPFKRQSFVSH